MSKIKKIKVLFAVNSFAFGGTERATYNLLKHIDRKYFDPEIFSLDSGPALRIFRKLGIPLWVPKGREYPSIGRLAELIKISSPDIIQSNTLSARVLLAGGKAGIPLVSRMGGHNKILLRGIDKQKLKHVLTLVSYLSKVIICPSRFLRTQFSEYGINNTILIRNGIDFTEINKYYLQNKSRTSHAPFLIGMVGAFVPSKRHKDILLAAKKLKEENRCVKVILMGSVYPMKTSRVYAAYIHNAVKKMGLTDTISFLGFRKDVFKIISTLDVVVMPSVDEGASNAIIEAMALGKPVIAANSGGNAEFIRDGKNGFIFEPKNYKELSKKIIALLENHDHATKIGELARKNAEKYFDAQDMTRKYENIYFRLLRNNLKTNL